MDFEGWPFLTMPDGRLCAFAKGMQLIFRKGVTAPTLKDVADAQDDAQAWWPASCRGDRLGITRRLAKTEMG